MKVKDIKKRQQVHEMASRQRFKIPSSNDVKDRQEEGKQYSLFKSYQQNKGKREKLPETKSSVSFSASGGKSQQESTVSTTTALSAVTSKLLSSGIRNEPSSTTGTTAKSPVTPLVAAAPPIAPPASSKPSADTGPAPATSSKTSSNSIIVNYRQRGNPILKHIRNVPWEYGSIIPDYVMGIANCALFLSLRYHQLHPEYLHNRLKELGKGYDLRVLLVQVDVKDPHHQLKDLAKICILADLTLILAFSPEEAGRYLEAYKVYENKSAEVLMEKTDTDYSSKLTECLTTVKSVNKTDSMTLLSAFKSMKGIINASKEDISLCAGFGPQKAQRLYDVFHEPFVKGRKRHVETNSDSNDFSRPKKNPP